MLRTMETKYGCLLRKEDTSIKIMAFLLLLCFVLFFERIFQCGGKKSK